MGINELFTPTFFRGVERIIIALSGMLSICFGYKLFQSVSDSVTDLKTEIGSFKLTLRRTAPGVLFALFGAAILFAGIAYQYKFSDEKTTIMAQMSVPHRTREDVPTQPNSGILKNNNSIEYAIGLPAGSERNENINNIAAIGVILAIKYRAYPLPAEFQTDFNGAVETLERLRNKIVQDTYGECYGKFLSIRDSASRDPKYLSTISGEEKKCYDDIAPLYERSLP